MMMAKSDAWFVELGVPAIHENRSQTAGEPVPAEVRRNSTAALSSRIEEPVPQISFSANVFHDTHRDGAFAEQ